MNVLHVPFCFYPDPVGGTEVYVQNLGLEQKHLGLEASIAAPGTSEQKYAHEGLDVRRFPGGRSTNLLELYGAGEPSAAEAFARILDTVRPDLVHLHALTAATSLLLVEAVQRAGLPIVYTYHTPTASCPRGTLMRWGKQLCDGRMDLRRCSACAAHAQGAPRGLAELIGAVPAGAGRTLGNLGLSGGPWTALRTTELLRLRQGTFREVMRRVDRIVSLCSWTTELLQRNGIPADKITLSRHGLRSSEMRPAGDDPGASPVGENGCRMAFLGRVNPTKGLSVLVQAISADPTLKLTLDIYGVVQGPGEKAYRETLEKGLDERIRFREPLASSEVVEALGGYDLLAVPSQWLETGPLVVLEAFAAGIPVIGSDLGGIRELVRHDVDGLLLPPASVPAWTASLRRLTTHCGLLSRLRAGVKPPRTMRTVAEQMASLYEDVLEKKARCLSGPVGAIAKR